MYDKLTRDQVRQFFCEAWSKFAKRYTLTPLEEVAVDWIIEHPEFHADLDHPGAAREREYLPEDGKTNPFLHLSMHLSISEQVAADQPTGIRSTYHALIRQTGSEHDAAHKIMDCLGEMIWMAQKHRTPFDFQMYLQSVEALANQAN
ncbi:MAG: DUF1841 family protein [Gammaproteobacteria bacterium]